jgi:hypothetical protein
VVITMASPCIGTITFGVLCALGPCSTSTSSLPSSSLPSWLTAKITRRAEVPRARVRRVVAAHTHTNAECLFHASTVKA